MSANDPSTDYVTLAEAAERFAVSVSTLRRRIRSGQLPHARSGLGRRVLVRPEDVAALLAPRPAVPKKQEH